MGEVDFHFRPSVPVFDANVALGRHRDRTVSVDTVEGTLSAMSKAGVDRALVYSTLTMQATPTTWGTADTWHGNQLLLDLIREAPNLVPQFACNPAGNDLNDFAAGLSSGGVRSVRMFPALHRYPFRDWAVKRWLDWLASEQIAAWITADQIDPSDLHDTLELHPDVSVVLCEVHYSYEPWAMLLLKSLPNLYIELSRAVSPDGIADLMEAVGEDRILYGSRFPDSPMPPQLYNLHRSGLSEASLRAICSGNLERLLREGS